MFVHLWEILVYRNTQNNIRKNIPKNEKEKILVASFVPFRYPITEIHDFRINASDRRFIDRYAKNNTVV